MIAQKDIDAVLHELHLEGFEPEKDADLMANLDKLQAGEVTLDDLIVEFRNRHMISD